MQSGRQEPLEAPRCAFWVNETSTGSQCDHMVAVNVLYPVRMCEAPMTTSDRCSLYLHRLGVFETS